MRAFSNLLLVAAAASLAGCGSHPVAAPKELCVMGEDAYVALGPHYDGHGLLRFSDGVAALHLRADGGLVRAQGRLENVTWDVRFDRFAPQSGRPYEDQGVAFDLDEHGTTGHGDASLPSVHALAAAWGAAHVMVAGKPWPDAVTGNATWVAHAMVLSTATREDPDLAVRADGAGHVYDPAQPERGVVHPGHGEVHVVLTNHTGLAPEEAHFDLRLDANGFRNATLVNRHLNVSGVQVPTYEVRPYSMVYAFANAYYGSALHLRANATATETLAAANLTFTLLDPKGFVLVSWHMGGGTPPQEQWGTDGVILSEPGVYHVRVDGDPADAQYRLTGVVRAPGKLTIDLLFRDVQVGSEARELARHVFGRDTDCGIPSVA